jgi:ribosomal protein S18 acetylase RimI-like enzyme
MSVRVAALTIRRAVTADAPGVSALIFALAGQFMPAPRATGAERFLRTITPEAIADYILNPRYLYLAGCIDQRLAGVVAIRDRTHLFHLFVEPAFQRQGVGRALWCRASSEAAATGVGAGFTVNSATSAVPVYERLGFRVTGPRVEQDGIAFVPMRLAVK